MDPRQFAGANEPRYGALDGSSERT